MGMFKTLAVAGAGFSIALMVSEARDPGSAAKTVESSVNGLSPALYGAAALPGPVLSGALSSAQTSGLGKVLTPTDTIPPAEQPDPET